MQGGGCVFKGWMWGWMTGLQIVVSFEAIEGDSWLGIGFFVCGRWQQAGQLSHQV